MRLLPEQQLTAAPEFELILELRPGHIEGWQKYSLKRLGADVKIVEEYHNLRHDLEPTDFVLECIYSTLEVITPEQIEQGTVVIGPRGLKLLERRVTRAHFAELERAVILGKLGRAAEPREVGA